MPIQGYSNYVAAGCKGGGEAFHRSPLLVVRRGHCCGVGAKAAPIVSPKAQIDPKKRDERSSFHRSEAGSDGRQVRNT